MLYCHTLPLIAPQCALLSSIISELIQELGIFIFSNLPGEIVMMYTAFHAALLGVRPLSTHASAIRHLFFRPLTRRGPDPNHARSPIRPPGILDLSCQCHYCPLSVLFTSAEFYSAVEICLSVGFTAHMSHQPKNHSKLINRQALG